MPTTSPTRRLSPKVRRLLRAHDVDHRSLPGTGLAGRVTPRDVLAAAERTDPSKEGTGLVEQEVDIARLWAAVAVAQGTFTVHNGFELDLVVPVARAMVTVLATQVDLVGDAVGPVDGGTGRARVHVGFVRTGVDPVAVGLVRDAQDLTVAGLARRARSDSTAADGDAEGARPAVVVAAGEVERPADVVAATGGVGLVTVSSLGARPVDDVDHLGCRVTRSRPHVQLRLHHDDRLTPEAANELLRALEATIEAWAVPVGP